MKLVELLYLEMRHLNKNRKLESTKDPKEEFKKILLEEIRK